MDGLYKILLSVVLRQNPNNVTLVGQAFNLNNPAVQNYLVQKLKGILPNTTSGAITENELMAAWLLANSGGGSGTVTSVDISSNGTALTISGNPITTAGTIAVDFNGAITDYVDGTGALQVFPTIPTVTPAALTRTDDTNVTLTLGGTPATALLQATSITVGWSGQLAVARGGTGLSALGIPLQALRVNSLGTALEYYTPTSGTVTSIATAGLISGGTITGSGTITTSMATNRLVGRATAGTGVMEEITLGTGLSFTGTTLNATGGGLTVGTTPIASGTVGRILFEGAGNVLQESANLFWNNTNSRLNIGNVTSNSPIDATNIARLAVKAQGSGSGSAEFIVRNSADTVNLFAIVGDGLWGFRNNAGTKSIEVISDYSLLFKDGANTTSIRYGSIPYFYADNTTNIGIRTPNNAFTIIENGNFLFTNNSGIQTGSGKNNILLQSATAPSTNIADYIYMYSADISAGNAAFHTRAEGAHIFYAGVNVGMRSNHNLQLAANNTVYATLRTTGAFGIANLAADPSGNNGDLYYNTANNKFRGYENGAWADLVQLTDSGTYTPTLTGVTNVTSTTAFTCQYMRVGNVVTVSGKLSVTATANNSQTVLGISLPIASNFAADENCGGLAHTINNTAADQHGASIYADATNNRATFDYYETHGSADDFTFTFTYRII